MVSDEAGKFCLYREGDKMKIQVLYDNTIAELELEPQINEEGLFTSFHVGQHVFHENLGAGEILHIAGSGESAKLTVKFDKEMKIFVAGYAKLREV